MRTKGPWQESQLRISQFGPEMSPGQRYSNPKAAENNEEEISNSNYQISILIFIMVSVLQHALADAGIDGDVARERSKYHSAL